MRRIFAFILLAGITVNFTSCYDNRETDTLATVMAVGIDKKDNSGMKTYTFAVADTGGLSEGKKGDSASLLCFTADGENIESAVRDMDKRISKELSFSHLSCIFFSVDAARDGMNNDINYFEKKIAVRPQIMVSVTEIESEEYLKKLSPVLEVNPEKYFRSVFEKGKTYVPAMTISDFTNAYHTHAFAFSPVISVSEGDSFTEENTSVDRCAVIHEGKMKMTTEDIWLLALFSSTKEVSWKNGVIKSVKAPKTDVTIQDGKPNVKVKLFVRSEDGTDISMLSQEAEEKLLYYAKSGCDFAGVADLVKKEFRLIKEYEEYAKKDFLKETDFSVSVEFAGGE